MSREKMLARGNTGRNRLDSLRLGSSRKDKFFFLGGEHITFRGTGGYWSSPTEYKGRGKGVFSIEK